MFLPKICKVSTGIIRGNSVQSILIQSWKMDFLEKNIQGSSLIAMYYNSTRDVLFEFHLFWNTASIGIPARSLL